MKGYVVIHTRGRIQKISRGWGDLTSYFSHQRISERERERERERDRQTDRQTDRENETYEPPSRRRSVPVFLRKPLATCDCSERGSGPMPPPPSGSAHVARTQRWTSLVSCESIQFFAPGATQCVLGVNVF